MLIPRAVTIGATTVGRPWDTGGGTTTLQACPDG
jgi:hypothetical protein